MSYAHTNIDIIGQLNVYMLNIYILHVFNLLQVSFHYMPLLFMEASTLSTAC